MIHLKNILSNVLRTILVVAILFSFGGGSTLLQGIAWISMFSGELDKSMPVGQALKNTFDGKKPCDLCMAADQMRKGELDASSNKESQLPAKPTLKKLCDGFIFSETLAPAVKISDCDRGWLESSTLWNPWLLSNVVTPPPQFI